MVGPSTLTNFYVQIQMKMVTGEPRVCLKNALEWNKLHVLHLEVNFYGDTQVPSTGGPGRKEEREGLEA